MLPARSFAALALLLLAGCLAGPRAPELAAPAPQFDPLRFFAGATRGEGVLEIILSGKKRVEVEGSGRIAPDGTLVLDQVVRLEGDPPRTRQWRLRRIAPDRYAGTLTDAEGPVTGLVDGNALHLRYVLADDGLRADQWLYLQPGRETALNRLTLSRFGIRVARLEETIRTVD